MLVAIGELKALDVLPCNEDRDRFRSFQPPLEVFTAMDIFRLVALGTLTRTGGRTGRFYPLHPIYILHYAPEWIVEFNGGMPLRDIAVVWDGEHFYETGAWHGAYRFEALLQRWREYEEMTGHRAAAPNLSYRERQQRALSLAACATELRQTLDWKPTPIGAEGHLVAVANSTPVEGRSNGDEINPHGE